MADIQIHRTHDEATQSPATAHACACGEHDDTMPELDVQTIPHAVRHAAIFGALDALRPGSGIVLSATHDPVPLLAQLQERHPDAFETRYLDRGPERWRIRLLRQA
ncbi:DUF2249 domain-containing protein [Agrococcus sp. Ld7]|uniref:DUF2249 domain-containing protein n=1 Tax=Agrococcus sp. Ld7 TaxID=649148 RepID=UPI003862FF6E